MPWIHLDLFYVRETNQKNMERLCEDTMGSEFVWVQFAITKDIIEQAKPCMLVVNNSFLEGTPVFFSSMLTRQRALDLGSLERLEWHIRFVRKKTEQCG